MEFTIGCDPELFIKLHDKYIPAFGLLPGTKENPYPVDGGAVQVDGLAFEFNIDPAKTPKEFNRNIEKVLVQMNEMIKQSIHKDAVLEFISVADFDPKTFEELPEDAKILGCDPDFNFKGTVNRTPQIQFQPFRVAAGHIHIGWLEEPLEEMTKAHFQDCVYVSEHLWNNKLGHHVTPDEARRIKYYGNQGSFRPKKYGIEYRVPSNRWVASAESRLKMFGSTMTLMKKALA